MRPDIKRSYAERRLQYIMEPGTDKIQNIETTDGQLYFPDLDSYSKALDHEMEIVEEEQDAKTD